MISEEDGKWLSKVKANKLKNIDLSVKLSLPDWFWLKLSAQYNEKKATQIANSLLSPAQLCVRVNTLKGKGSNNTYN